MPGSSASGGSPRITSRIPATGACSRRTQVRAARAYRPHWLRARGRRRTLRRKVVASIPVSMSWATRGVANADALPRPDPAAPFRSPTGRILPVRACDARPGSARPPSRRSSRACRPSSARPIRVLRRRGPALPSGRFPTCTVAPCCTAPPRSRWARPPPLRSRAPRAPPVIHRPLPIAASSSPPRRPSRWSACPTRTPRCSRSAAPCPAPSSACAAARRSRSTSSTGSTCRPRCTGTACVRPGPWTASRGSPRCRCRRAAASPSTSAPRTRAPTGTTRTRARPSRSGAACTGP